MDHVTKATTIATKATIPNRQVSFEATSQSFGPVATVIANGHWVVVTSADVFGSAMEVDLGRVEALGSLLDLAVGHQNFLVSEGTNLEEVPSCLVTRTIVVIVLGVQTNFADCRGVAEVGDLTLGSILAEEGLYSNSAD